jgi:S-adenosylmethionine hydrolase
MNHKFFLHPVSATFHGRDIFAPVAAHLACGLPPSRFGKPVQEYLRLSFEDARNSQALLDRRTPSGPLREPDH